MHHKNSETLSNPYSDWLKEQGVTLYQGSTCYWRKYRGALVPAKEVPFYTDIDRREAKALLKNSGALFLRYTNHPVDFETAWWYVVCDSYDFQTLSKKVRNQIRKSQKLCHVEKVDVDYIIDKAYECYQAAYQRYTNAQPLSKLQFTEELEHSKTGPFEYWVVITNETIAGYCQCIIDGSNVATSILKLHPGYLNNYTSYALVTELINHYVLEKKMIISNGSRAISHETKFQEVLIKLGFRKQFCRINLYYHPLLKTLLYSLYPFRHLVRQFKNLKPVHHLNSLLYQEELRRRCISP